MIKRKKIAPKRTLGRKVINGFILTFASFIALLIFFFGFSQTSTFRNYLKDKIISEVNSSINGNFNIESLNGSVLTSIILKNTSLEVDQDTLLKSESISLKLEPHKLLFDLIYVRQLSIFNADINIHQDKDLVWNLDKLSKPDNSDKKISETEIADSSGGFPYTIQIENFDLGNINLKYTAFEFSDSSKNYDVINWDDLDFQNINLSASIIADIRNSNFNLNLRHISFSPNSESFSLNHLAGNFLITPEFAEIENFAFYTDSTQINLNARLENLNIFGDINLEDFQNYPLNIKVNAPKIHFDDITYFIGATDILKGTPSLNFEAEGLFGDFLINYMELKFSKTSMLMTGRVQYLHTPEKLYINSNIKNSTIFQPDANKLLPEIGIPIYPDVLMKNINMKFRGEPIDFVATITGDLNKGKINATADMNLKKEEAVYDLSLETQNLNLTPLLNINSRLNSKIKFRGIGFSPQKMNSEILIEAYKSKILDYSFDSLSFNADAADKKIYSELSAIVEGADFESSNLLDFTDTLNTGFEFLGDIKNLNLQNILNDTTHNSALNINYNLSGSNLDLSKTVANLNLTIENSTYQNRKLDFSELDFLIAYDSRGNRNIQLYSEILDFNINGKFDLPELINLIPYESNVISKVMISKLIKLNPLYIITDSTTISTDELSYDKITKSKQKADYKFNFKNSTLTQFLLGGTNITLAANGNGFLENDSTGFSLSNEINIDHFTRIEDGNPIYISDLYLNLHLSRNNNLIKFKDLFGNISIEGKRIYAGSEIANLESEISFNANKLYYDIHSRIDTTLSFASEGLVNMSDSIQIIDINNFQFSYNNSKWNNQDSIKLIYKPLSFELQNFNLKSGPTSITAFGELYNFGEQDFDIEIKQLKNNNLSKFLTFLDDPQFNTSIDGRMLLKGSFDYPVIDASITVDSLSYGDKKLGKILGKFDYQNQTLATDLNVVNPDSENDLAALNITSNLPVNLSFNPVVERIISHKELSIHLLSTEFNLNTFGNTLPVIKQPNGILIADIEIDGTFNDINYSGFAEVNNSRFTMDINNLEYLVDFKLNFDHQTAKFESLQLKNSDDVKFIGTLDGNGEINFKGMAPEKFNIFLNGDLSVLGQKSKLANTNYFGDLFVATSSPLAFEYDKGNSSLDGNLLLRETDILYSVVDEANLRLNSDIIYKYKIDSTKIDQEELRFKALLSEVDTVLESSDYNFSNFNFNLGFTIEKNARLVIVLPNLLNQKLFIEADGGFTYSSINNVPRAQGTINLLPGSTLEFFKTFDADGSLRFESELSNPYLDINAIYLSDYKDLNDVTEPVAVKIKIEGPLENLGESLSSANDNISVQRGSSNIENNIKDARYDFSDALTFLAFNKFKEDLSNAQNRGDWTTSFGIQAGMSLAGTFLSDLFNSSVGGVINNVQLSQRVSDDNYTFNLSGRYKDFRYSFGSAFSEIMLGKVLLEVEYLLSPNFSIRGAQRRPVGSIINTSNDERVRELGLKYKIEF